MVETPEDTIPVVSHQFNISILLNNLSIQLTIANCCFRCLQLAMQLARWVNYFSTRRFHIAYNVLWWWSSPVL